MAVRLEIWSGSQGDVGATAQPAGQSRILTLQERQARLVRRRRLSRGRAVLEGTIWLAGSGAVILLALAGMFGLK